MSEEVNVKVINSFPMAYQFVCNDIFPCTSRKIKTQFVVMLSIDIPYWTVFEIFLTFFSSNDNCL